MHDFLKNSITEGDITVWRGGKSSWMFGSVPINNGLEKLIRTIVFFNYKTRKDLVYPNNNRYSSIPETSIYDYLKTKKTLTLADAMLCAKYLPDAAVKKILEMINNSEIIDSNFKSCTLDKKFALDWAKNKPLSSDKNMLSILSKIKIPKGSQAGYAANNQYEFILNNNPKKFTFSNAEYDKKTNTFFLDSEVKNL